MTIAKNSRTRLLLENALKQASSPEDAEVPAKSPVNGTPSSDPGTTVIVVPPEAVQVSTRPVPRSATKINEYGISFVVHPPQCLIDKNMT